MLQLVLGLSGILKLKLESYVCVEEMPRYRVTRGADEKSFKLCATAMTLLSPCHSYDNVCKVVLSAMHREFLYVDVPACKSAGLAPESSLLTPQHELCSTTLITRKWLT